MIRRSRQSGFTLLEVLVALAVLAIAMTALVRAAGDNAANQVYLEERILAHWVALNQLALARLEPTPLPQGHSEGTEMMAGREWRWEMLVATTPDVDVLKVEVAVGRAERADGHYVSISGYVGVPQ